ncbi:DUF2069 domain-containing protein [Marilutibacter maris]|uniref:DUF2069 domain-containing protein n=1 Tax=Marilutibacter maris TaxID=1605891 RepID=A0A2U9T683_9GAMM|nr:DUF2069 domain-containing protein [Lysobacter maris]AWV08061.1 membrane protein [Lysobacter maris]KAB8198829.1 DUF2069 domain-containing protein [Lysobacter maris]
MSRTPRRGLAALLLTLSLVYAGWFRDDAQLLAAMGFFALPPLLLAVGAWFGSRHAVFWSGVFGLGWFCHGVMMAWAHRDQAGWAWAVIVLSVAIIVTGSLPGLRARFGRGR